MQKVPLVDLSTSNYKQGSIREQALNYYSGPLFKGINMESAMMATFYLDSLVRSCCLYHSYLHYWCFQDLWFRNLRNLILQFNLSEAGCFSLLPSSRYLKIPAKKDRLTIFHTFRLSVHPSFFISTQPVFLFFIL